ncbi:Protein F49E10.2 a [Aphelenchoides avenae]|nr:Protein F49E10.2 a [Aphelenchus avenae]
MAGQVIFSAQYYPARPYKIWEFYDRNMTKASVPWAGWSDYNRTAMAKWEQVPPNLDAAHFHPNLDFWKIGTKVIAGTEAPQWVGYEFDVRTLDKFKLFPLVEENDVFGTPRPNSIPISMAIHERNDPDGTLWGSFSAVSFKEHKFFQGVFTVDKDGVRRVVGMYDFGQWEEGACDDKDEYIGDKTLLPGYMHSITSTEKYIILPLTSLLINPCKFKEPPVTNPKSPIQNGGLWGMDFYDMVPMRFLVFNKEDRTWITQKPMEVFPSMFVTHQLNAFENPDGTVTADMVVYESHDPYVKYFYTDFLTSQIYPSTARIVRFTMDMTAFRVKYDYLIPQETISADFPQINHAFDGRAYQWAYLVEHPFAADNAILKINVDDPSGSRNIRYKTEPTLVLHEPWFVPRPNAQREDDGVLVARALDLSENKGVLLVIDASTMVEMGRAYVPISVPFGFHNRFYSKRELGLPEGALNGLFRPSSGAETRARPPGPSPPVTQPPPPEPRPAPPGPVVPPVPSPVARPVERTIFSSTRLPLARTSTWAPQPTAITPELPSGPTWVPVAASTNPPHWRSTPAVFRPRPIQPSTVGFPKVQTPITPTGSIMTVTMRPPGTTRRVTINSPFKPTITSESGFTHIYQRTLTALCHWVSNLFTSVTYDGCMERGNKIARWLSPLADSQEMRSHILRAATMQSFFQQEGNTSPVAANDFNLRPKLQQRMPFGVPWYNYRVPPEETAGRK